MEQFKIENRPNHTNSNTASPRSKVTLKELAVAFLSLSQRGGGWSTEGGPRVENGGGGDEHGEREMDGESGGGDRRGRCRGG